MERIIELLSEVGIITITKMKNDNDEYFVRFYDTFVCYDSNLLKALKGVLEYVLNQDFYFNEEQKELAKELLCN